MKCVCGHPDYLHIPLPMHPDFAVECQGSDDCECGRFRLPKPAQNPHNRPPETSQVCEKA